MRTSSSRGSAARSPSAARAAAAPIAQSRAPHRLVVVTTDPERLSAMSTWYLLCNLPRSASRRAQQAHLAAGLRRSVVMSVSSKADSESGEGSAWVAEPRLAADIQRQHHRQQPVDLRLLVACSARSTAPRKPINAASTRPHCSRKTRSRVVTNTSRSDGSRWRRPGGPPGSAPPARSPRRGRRPPRRSSRRPPP